MKKIIALIVFLASHSAYSQTINWKNLDTTKQNIYYASVNLELGLSGTIGASYLFKTKVPILVFLDATLPTGKKAFDDFKTRMGAQIKLYTANQFGVSAKFSAIYRRYESDFVQMQNFGSEVSAAAGFYKRKWFVAGEIGLDKAIITHFKHHEAYKTIFTDVQDGWYEPSAGGILNFGLQGGVSFKNADITINMGKLLNQDLKTTPTLPLYVKIGLNIHIK